MGPRCTLNAIAPARVLRGGQAWQEAQGAIQGLCTQPLVLGRSVATAPVRAELLAELPALTVSTLLLIAARRICRPLRPGPARPPAMA